MDKIIKYSKKLWCKAFLPTTNTVDVYRFNKYIYIYIYIIVLDKLLKHMPGEELVTIENNLLYCKERVIYQSD